MADMTNIEIRDFTTAQGVNDSDYVVLSLSGGSSAKLLVGLLRSSIMSKSTPSIVDGVWWIGEDNTGVQAVGQTPTFNKTDVGIMWKYTSESDDQWKVLANLSDLRFDFDELTDEQRKLISLKLSDLTAAERDSLTLHFSDLTEDEIAELQSPATEMIEKLEQTNTEIKAEFAELKEASEAATASAKSADAATEAAQEATSKANTATENANTATANANSAADKANTAASEADKATQDAQEATEEAEAATTEAEEATTAANNATTQILAAFGGLVPFTMEVECMERITLGNLSPKAIDVVLTPVGTLKNVIFLSDNKAVTVAPDGRIQVVAKGRSTVHVIPTLNTALAKTLQIEVTEPTLRLVTNRSTLRLTEAGVLRLN